VATSLNNLAVLYRSQGRYTEAEPLYKQALELTKRTLGENHSDVASSLNNLAVLYQYQGRYTEAEPLYKQALELRKRTLGENHPDVARSFNNLAVLYQSQGRYTEAEPLYKQALELTKRTLGENHPDVATSLDNLAVLYQYQGRYTEAEPLYKQALELRKRTLGENHPDVARSFNNLAVLYQSQGRYTEAEPLLQQALALNKRTLGENHPDVAESLNNLAVLYQSQGRYTEAGPLLQQALALNKRTLGENHPDVATSLDNLASLYADQGRYTEAEPLFQQALALRRRTLGESHPNVATSLNNLAALYDSQGRYSEAEPLYKQALEVSKRALGETHPTVASSLSNLALLYHSQGRYAEAEPLLKQALALSKRTLGETHPDVANSLNNLAGLYESQGVSERAIAFLSQGMQIEERNLDINLVVGSEQQKRDYITTISGTTNVAISLHFQAAPTNPDAARLALTSILQRKGRILDALTDNLNRLRQNLTPADQILLDNLASTRTQLATLYYGGLGKLTPEQYKERITQLQQQSTQLEAELNNRSATFRTENQPITLAAVQKQIPVDAALVELVSYKPFNPKAKLADRFGKPRYAAYILSPQGTIQAVDLGDAAAIDLQAEAFRQALRSRDSRVKAIARQLDAVVMQPIRAKLGNTRNLLISPDSQLNLIPFAALVDEQNRYLVETYDINYLTSGRDLLRLQTPIASRQPPVLMANPDYAASGDPASAQMVRKGGAIASNKPATLVAATTPTAARGTNQRSTDLATLRVEALPGTLAEANAIAPKLKGAIVLTGAQATENALKQVQAPRILHIATHGFFLADAAPTNIASRSPMLSPLLNEANSFGGIRPPTSGNTENALLRSGLALAGFNRRQSGSEDGVLTAQEAAGLDLHGTQLVVLSACETGIGNVANGEGVYGLRRAFVLAGAASQLTSLWQVSDDGTKDLMVQYYDRLLANQGRSDALRQTQLDFLHSDNYAHPYYWAAFVPSGDWRSLKQSKP
jgi:CHAT domain-containing protein/Tfp pilus assembly protein PilF